MHKSRKPARRAFVSAALLLALGAGCGSGSAAVPSTDTARDALDAALTAWTRGETPGELAGTETSVFVHDTPWSQGQRLASFEIIEESEAEGAVAEKRFTVRLSLAQPDRAEEVQYHVLGTDPLMVFRDEDYQRNINMVNGPSTTAPPSRGQRPR
ncbi:hypothetical protein [Tautonia plasticadhaerens]|uniref:Uncharacterized protein n=1 Tax=Tautonia plasticadhaerens TaxID=2527974 RepID=A0A518H5W6_9BACT|nr:hypothetical protein [Tautonia plasticadhaerens]QDV36220.1 hypothetical protein ElP_41390 [Tautonia plasticadhaerens]